jgi:hypothetical protein
MYSMTGDETLDVLERVRRHALARFSSTYTVGFVPSPSGALRQHQLVVKLASNSSGKVTERERSATYWQTFLIGRRLWRCSVRIATTDTPIEISALK